MESLIILAKRNLEFPLFFIAMNLETGMSISCRAYEFNGPPGIAIASEWVRLGLWLGD